MKMNLDRALDIIERSDRIRQKTDKEYLYLHNQIFSIEADAMGYLLWRYDYYFYPIDRFSE